MHRPRRWPIIAGTALATVALTFSSIGVVAQDCDRRPADLDRLRRARPGPWPAALGKVTIQTQWLGGEGEDFAAAFAPFEAATGIDVVSPRCPRASTRRSSTCRSRAARRPTSSCWRSRRPSSQYGEEGSIVDIATLHGRRRRSSPTTRLPSPLYTTGDSIWAHPLQGRRQVGRLVPHQGLRGRRLRGPHDVGRAHRPLRPDRRRRRRAWCRVDIGSGRDRLDHDGLVEDIMLRTAGNEAYDQWITHELPFNSPEVKDAFDLAGQIFFTPGYVAGRQHRHPGDVDQTTPWTRCSTTTSRTPAAGCRSSPSGTAPTSSRMSRPGGSDSKYIVGEDVGFFYFPPIDRGHGHPGARRR